MDLIGKTRTVIDPCDCDGGFHSGHVRYLDYEERRNPRMYRKRGGRKSYRSVRFDFTLNGHNIPRFLGRWLCHRKLFGRRLANYNIEYLEQPADPC